MGMNAKVKKNIREYIMITLAAVIMDIGIYAFKFPNNFSFGGVSGMAVVLAKLLPFTAAEINLFVNMLLLIIGFIFLGRDFGAKTAYVTVLSSILLNVFEKAFPMSGPLTNERVLELFFAIILPAIASAMFFYENASGGGTDIIAMIVKKYSTTNVSMALLYVDTIVVLVAFVTFDITIGLCSVFGLIAKTLLIDKAIERMKLNKYFTIICNNSDKICTYITETLGRSATLYTAEGAYSHEHKAVILTAMDPRQAVLLERFIEKEEPRAFLMITKSSEIVGKGFSSYI